MANIDLIYDNAKLPRIYKIYDLFYNKIICKYLNIEGLKRLFNENIRNLSGICIWELLIRAWAREIIIDHFIH